MPMTIEGKASGIIAETDDKWDTLRVSSRPLDYGTGGFYRVVATSGALTGLAANNPCWCFRWTSSTLYAVVLHVRWTWFTTTVFTTGQDVSHNLFIARSFTAADTGGSTLTMSGNNAKKRTTMATSAVGEIRYSTTGTLTAGTRTLDAQPIMARHGITTSAVQGYGPIDDGAPDYNIGHVPPVVLSVNEGLVLQNGSTAMGAGGVIKLMVECAWAEIPLANWA